MTNDTHKETMPALVWVAPRKMEMQVKPVPVVQEEEVLIKVAYAGICGSELGGYLGHNALRVPPLVMGHEFSGEIVSLGRQAQAQYPNLHPGTRVTANPLVYCGKCEYCQKGVNQLCANRKLIGAARPGAFAQYISVPAQQVIVLPEAIPMENGALAEPVACGVRIAELAGPVKDEAVLVVGAGTIGLCALQALLLQGAKRVFISDINPERLAAGARLGGEALDPRAVDVVKTVRQATGGRGVTAAVDAVGSAATRLQCVSATRSTGTVILSGLHEETSAMPAADIIRREIVARGSFAYSPANFARAVELLAQGSVHLEPWTVQAPLSEGGAWFDRLVEGTGVAKVLLVP
jgi:threonine dehydrogenase-like Zn-dependent dehydrogenase